MWLLGIMSGYTRTTPALLPRCLPYTLPCSLRYSLTGLLGLLPACIPIPGVGWVINQQIIGTGDVTLPCPVQIAITIVVGHHSDASRIKTAMFLAPFNRVPIRPVGIATPVQPIAAGHGAVTTTEVSVRRRTCIAGAAAIIDAPVSAWFCTPSEQVAQAVQVPPQSTPVSSWFCVRRRSRGSPVDQHLSTSVPSRFRIFSCFAVL
jgi:hypothetical protein